MPVLEPNQMSKPGPLIAIVDDDESIRRSVKRLMMSAGLRAESYSSGQELLHAIKTNLPDCLVLDVQMPGMNGLEIQDRLAASGIRVPIVFVTGYEDSMAEARALKAGAAAFLYKPFSNRSLLEVVSTTVGWVKSV